MDNDWEDPRWVVVLEKAFEWKYLEADALRKDAARYRWLRRMDHFGEVDAMLDTTEYNTLDAAVDAAMSAQEPPDTASPPPPAAAPTD
jgi:hypothetical protein